MRYPPKVADRGEWWKGKTFIDFCRHRAWEAKQKRRKIILYIELAFSICLFGDYCKLKNFLLLNYNFHRLWTMKQALLQQKISGFVIKLQIKGFSHFLIRILQSNLKPVRMLLEVGANGYLYSTDVEYREKLILRSASFKSLAVL